ncbi:TPA: DUF1629 domain-containing protein [Citrobacter gillenii]
MNNFIKEFFIILHNPDRKGVPVSMATTWNPDLPNCNYYHEPPSLSDIFERYTLSAKTNQLDGDYFVKDYLVSASFLELCSDFNVRFISAPTNVSLYGNKKPNKNYYLFFILDYLSLLDEKKSVFTVAKNIRTGEELTHLNGGKKTYYDKIEKFCVRDDVFTHLFFCDDIAKPVCSREFKEKFELLGLKGVKFEKIDENYKYDAWEGW